MNELVRILHRTQVLCCELRLSFWQLWVCLLLAVVALFVVSDVNLILGRADMRMIKRAQLTDCCELGQVNSASRLGLR